MQEELDEFTGRRLKKISLTFCDMYKAHGLKPASAYLNKMNIKEKHYPLVREFITMRLNELGLKL